MPDKPQDFSTKAGQIMLYAAWIVFLLFLTYLFSNYLEKKNNPNITLNVQTSTDGVAEVILQRNRYGHYVANGTINDQVVTFLLDTGATVVSIPESIAQDLNLQAGAPISVNTANGSITVYSTRVKEISIGPIQFHNIRAHINPYMDGKDILLGMNFMKHLEMIQKQDQLTLRLSPEAH